MRGLINKVNVKVEYDKELDRLVSIEEACEYLKCSKTTLFRAKGDIGFIKKGKKCVGFLKRNLVEYLRSKIHYSN